MKRNEIDLMIDSGEYLGISNGLGFLVVGVLSSKYEKQLTV